MTKLWCRLVIEIFQANFLFRFWKNFQLDKIFFLNPKISKNRSTWNFQKTDFLMTAHGGLLFSKANCHFRVSLFFEIPEKKWSRKLEISESKIYYTPVHPVCVFCKNFGPKWNFCKKSPKKRVFWNQKTLKNGQIHTFLDFLQKRGFLYLTKIDL